MSGRGGGQGREGGGRRGGHFGDGRGTDGGRGEWDAGGVGALIMIGSGGRRDMEGWFPEIGSGVINTAKLLLHVSIFLSGVGKAICTPPPDLRSSIARPAPLRPHRPPAQLLARVSRRCPRGHAAGVCDGAGSCDRRRKWDGGRASGRERAGGNLRDHVGRREGHWGIG